MYSTQDLIEMFNEHLDSTYIVINIENIGFFASEILEKFPNAYDAAFQTFLDDIGAEWVETDEDGFYKLPNTEQ